MPNTYENLTDCLLENNEVTNDFINPSYENPYESESNPLLIHPPVFQQIRRTISQKNNNNEVANDFINPSYENPSYESESVSLLTHPPRFQLTRRTTSQQNNNNEVVSDFTNPLYENPPYENESTRPPRFQSTRHTTYQSNNILSIIQMIFNSISPFEEQIDELKDQLNQMRQFVIAQQRQQQQQQQQQQQSSVPRRINRNRTARSHPYLNEQVSSRTPTIRSAAPTRHHEYFTTEQPIPSNNYQHQVDAPAETADNSEFSSAGPTQFW